MSKREKKYAFMASQKPEAKEALSILSEKYGNHDAGNADILVPLGGDGFMLQTLRRHMPLLKRGLPIYGMNRGTVGFLMNEFQIENLPERIKAAEATAIHPLQMKAEGRGGIYKELAFNEVSLYRQTRQAAHIKVVVDDKVRLEKLVADGILLATPVGSTAYNLSAHGPVLPIGAGILALTPISAFRPRRWRGALLKAHARVELEVLDPIRRPVSATADSQEIRNIRRVTIEQDLNTSLTLLFDKEQGLDEKILQEQFAT
ncbi:MAG: NAD kinase [Maricaulaceae bacterium]